MPAFVSTIGMCDREAHVKCGMPAWRIVIYDCQEGSFQNCPYPRNHCHSFTSPVVLASLDLVVAFARLATSSVRRCGGSCSNVERYA